MVDFQERDTRRGLDELRRDRQADEGTRHEGQQGGHDHHAADVESLRAAVLTISSTRTMDDDPSGDALAEAFDSAGHEITTRELVPDAFDTIQRTVNRLADRKDVDIVVTTGGTGVTQDDVTPEAVGPLFDKDLPGFGELFRRRSEEEIGTHVVATRATGGIVGGVPVFCLPGSEHAVRLGIQDIVLPEAGHLVGLARTDGGDEDTNEE